MVWHSKELDADGLLGWRSRIASEALCPREPKVRPLRSRKDHRRRCGAPLAGRVLCTPHLDVLITHTLHTRPPMLPSTPITPEEGSGADGAWVQQHTYLTRLLGGSTLPLTLFTQGAGTTTADAGRIDDAQAPIGFPASLVRHQRLPGGATERAIRLQGNVLPREATVFPGQGHGCQPIPLSG